MKYKDNKIQFINEKGFDGVDFEIEIKKLVPNLDYFELISEANNTKIFKFYEKNI